MVTIFLQSLLTLPDHVTSSQPICFSWKPDVRLVSMETVYMFLIPAFGIFAA